MVQTVQLGEYRALHNGCMQVRPTDFACWVVTLQLQQRAHETVT
jgi:hypothetical protein